MVLLATDSLLVLVSFCAISLASGSPRNLLVFGGNGFIGSAFVTRALKNGFKSREMCLVNRDSWYWDSGERVRPKTLHAKCDRQISLSECTDLKTALLANFQSNLHAVVDFSGYHSEWVKNAVQLFRELGVKVGVYLYISTDSVYEVAAPKKHSGPTRETDDRRPLEADERERLAKEDPYGHRKLECEEYLRSDEAADVIGRRVFLRLSDVIGPRDVTNRFWTCQLWARLSETLDLPISMNPALRDRSISLTYVEDVARVLLHILDLPEKRLEKIANQSFNVAFREDVTVPKLFRDIGRLLPGVGSDLRINFHGNSDFYLYPSVVNGAVSVGKLTETFPEFTLTSLSRALSETVSFYERAMTDARFEKERDKFLGHFREFLPESKTRLFAEDMLEIYNITLQQDSLPLYTSEPRTTDEL